MQSGLVLRSGLALLLGAGLVACDSAGGGLLTAPWLDVPDCTERGAVRRLEPFEMHVDHLGLQAASDGVTVRLGPAATEAWRADQLVFSIPEAAIREAAGGPFRVELDASAIGDPASGRLSIALLRTCTYYSAALVGRGYVEIDTWGTRAGDRVAGRISADIIDPRSGEVRAVGLAGDFDLEVKTGTPYTGFAPRHY